MDIAQTCIPNLSIQPALVTENRESLLSSSSTNKNTESSIDDFDDSFDVFIPLKNKAVKNLSSTAINFNSIGGKGKPKVNKIKNRACPYFKSKSVKQYFKPTSKSKEDEDLELALARSLVDFSGNNETSLTTNNEGENKLKPKQNKEFKLENWNGKISKKPKKSILSRRTEDDRNRIITQKLAIILLENKSVDWSEDGKQIELASYSLNELLNKNSVLWELSKMAIEDNDLSQYYVSSLINYINPQTTSSPSRNVEMDFPDNKSEDYKMDEINEMEMRIGKVNISSNSEFPKVDIPNNHSTLDSLKILSEDWSNLYGNSKFSDIEVLLRYGKLQCHKLVLAVRCSAIMKDIDTVYTPNVLDLSQYSLRAAKLFLKYIYSANVSDLHSLNEHEKEDLYVLTQKYDLPDLEALALQRDNDMFYDKSTCTPPSDPEDSVNLPDWQLNHNVETNSFDLFDSGNFNESLHKEEEANIRNTFPGISTSPGLNDDRVGTSISKANHFKRRSNSPDIILFRVKKPCSENSNLISDVHVTNPEIVTLDSDKKDLVKTNKNVVQNDFWYKEHSLSPDSAKINYIVSQDNDNNPNKDNSMRKMAPVRMNVTQESSISSNYKKVKKCEPKSSLDVYLDTSFPSFNEDLSGIGMASSPKNVSTPLPSKGVSSYSKGNVTPSNNLIIKDASPLADYSRMESPILKNELSKYGIKQNIGRKKSTALLKYIQDQLHPKLQLPNSPTTSTSRDSPSPIETICLDSDSS